MAESVTKKFKPIEVVTLIGMSWANVIEKMTEVLPDKAYKKIPTSAGLTDINPAYLRECLTACFGPYGVGWWNNYRPRHLKVESTGQTGMKAFKAHIDAFELVIVLVVNDEKRTVPIPASGSSSNSVYDYAANGAITSALGKAASYLLWQQDVYKGILTHDTVVKIKRTAEAKQQVAKESSKPAALMGDEGIQVLLDTAVKAGYDLKITRVRNALFKALGIITSPLNKMTRASGRIVYSYCLIQVGVSKDAIDGVKSYGKAIAKLAMESGLTWDDAAEQYKGEFVKFAESIGGKVVSK